MSARALGSMLTLMALALSGCLSATQPLPPGGASGALTVGGLAEVPDFVADGATITKLADAAELLWEGIIETPSELDGGLPMNLPVVGDPLAKPVVPVDHTFEVPPGVTSVRAELVWEDAAEALSVSIPGHGCSGRAPSEDEPTKRVCRTFIVGERAEPVEWVVRVGAGLGDAMADPEAFTVKVTLSVQPFTLQGPALAPEQRSASLKFWGAPVSEDRHSAEPSIKVDGQGVVYVAAPSGRLGALWRSTDDGATFDLLDIEANAGGLGPVWSEAGSGGGDAEVYVTPDGREVYFADLWGTCMTVASSSDAAESWWVNPLSCDLPGTDRQWLWALPGGQLWLTFNGDSVQGRIRDAAAPVTGFSAGGLVVLRSLDGGKTWLTRTNVPEDQCARGNMVVPDPARPAGGPMEANYVFVAGCNADGPGVAVSDDGGLTFTWVNVAPRSGEALDGFCFVCGIFTVIDADTEGNLYVVWADPSEGNSFDIWLSTSQDQGTTWSAPVRVNRAVGTSILPWVAAGEPGHAVVAWYQAKPEGKPSSMEAEWYVHLAESTDALEAQPTFEENLLREDPVQYGPLCIVGSACASARNLLDFLMVDIGPAGEAHVAYVDGTQGQSYGYSTVMYARQTAGQAMAGSDPAPATETSAQRAT